MTALTLKYQSHHYHFPMIFAHTILLSDALSHFLAKAKHMFLVTMTRFFPRAAIHDKVFLTSRGTLSFCLIHH